MCARETINNRRFICFWKVTTAHLAILILVYDYLVVMLYNIRNLIIAGKYAVSRNHRWVEKRWDEETETDTYFISDNWTGEKIPLTEEGSLTDLKDLPQMNRLDYLIVCMEPLKTLDGIDRFKELRGFEVHNCPKLTDISQIFTVEYGKGRIFHITMGHCGETLEDNPAMQCAGFQTMLLRGSEWCATGKVTQKVPADFPTETSVSLRPDYKMPE